MHARLAIDARRQRARDRQRHHFFMGAGHAGGARIIAAVAGVHRDDDAVCALRRMRGAHAAWRFRTRRWRRRLWWRSRQGGNGLGLGWRLDRRRAVRCRRGRRRRGASERCRRGCACRRIGGCRGCGIRRCLHAAFGRCTECNAQLVIVAARHGLQLRLQRRSQLHHQPERVAVAHPRAHRCHDAVLGRLRQFGATQGAGQVDDQALGILQPKHMLRDRRRQRQGQHRALAVGLQADLLQLRARGLPWRRDRHGGQRRHDCGDGASLQMQTENPGSSCRSPRLCARGLYADCEYISILISEIRA